MPNRWARLTRALLYAAVTLQDRMRRRAEGGGAEHVRHDPQARALPPDLRYCLAEPIDQPLACKHRVKLTSRPPCPLNCACAVRKTGTWDSNTRLVYLNLARAAQITHTTLRSCLCVPAPMQETRQRTRARKSTHTSSDESCSRTGAVCGLRKPQRTLPPEPALLDSVYTAVDRLRSGYDL